MPPKVSFLTVIWGEAYIERFASLALPSFLAPGNLPALAQQVDLEVVIMTQRGDIAFFEKHPAYRRLTAVCPVRFVEIDDLVTNAVYGVTLTLAYLRPIVQMGEKMLERHFLFMNADFVLADGSLRSLARHILDGRSIVLGPSFRATAEDVEPALHTLIDRENGILAIPPRKLTALSIQHPHPTTVAKTLNQGFCHTIHPNQFFWKVDENCMLGHYFLIFMLCLKPERVIQSINSYCDYAFIPELCPSGDEVAMGDSDEFFMLELQEREQERALLKLGRLPEKEIALSLQYWTTSEHRRASRHPIVFHTRELPPELDRIKQEAVDFLDRIDRWLGPPVPHAGHYYWIHGTATWRYLRKLRGLVTDPPELASPGNRKWISLRDLRAQLSRIRGLLLRCSLGFMYATRPLFRILRGTPLHPLWLDFRHLESTAGTLPATPGMHPLFVQDHDGALDKFAAQHPKSRLVSLEDLPDLVKAGTADPHTHLILYLTRRNSARIQDILRNTQSIMTTGFSCRVFIHYLGGELEARDLSSEMMYEIEHIIGQPPMNVTCTFVGGYLKRRNIRLFLRLSGHYTHFGIVALLWILPIMSVALPWTALTNLIISRRQPSAKGIKVCSSAALIFNEIPSKRFQRVEEAQRV